MDSKCGTFLYLLVDRMIVFNLVLYVQGLSKWNISVSRVFVILTYQVLLYHYIKKALFLFFFQPLMYISDLLGG